MTPVLVEPSSWVIGFNLCLTGPNLIGSVPKVHLADENKACTKYVLALISPHRPSLAIVLGWGGGDRIIQRHSCEMPGGPCLCIAGISVPVLPGTF